MKDINGENIEEAQVKTWKREPLSSRTKNIMVWATILALLIVIISFCAEKSPKVSSSVVVVPTPVPTPAPPKLVEPDIYIQAGEMKIIHLSETPVLVQVEESPCVYLKVLGFESNNPSATMASFYFSDGSQFRLTPEEWRRNGLRYSHTPAHIRFHISGLGMIKMQAITGPCKWSQMIW